MTPKTPGNTTGQFFEVAPSRWASVKSRRTLCEAATPIPGTRAAIGTGKQNTRLIAATPGCETGAAAHVLGYTGGGFDDWFLPSSNELNAIWQRLVQPAVMNRDLTGPGSNDFISSTDFAGSGGEFVRAQYLKTGRASSGKRGGVMKHQYTYNYFPVRMFTLPLAPSAKPLLPDPLPPKPEPVFN